MPYSYDRRKQAGGIDVMEDVTALLPALAGDLGSYKSKDIAHAAYVWEYIAANNVDRRTKAFADKLATEYARRFADWLGYVFLNRANMTRRSKAMKGLQEALGEWVEAIPEMLATKTPKPLSGSIPGEARKFVDINLVDKIGDKILRVVYADWAGTKRASMDELPITYNRQRRVYEIPKSKMTFPHRRLLRDLGFEFDGQVWYTDELDSRVLRALPQAAELQRGGAPSAPPSGDPREWFFGDWLPKNIERFSRIFNDFGRAAGVPYEFKFVVHGDDVTVSFERNVKTVADAVKELEERYGGSGDREGWLQAVASYHELSSASGSKAIHAVDKANNLEHTHGAMMEHFPPGVRNWYPAFLDFKYTANVTHMAMAIRDEDLRTVTMELLPAQERMKRLAPEHLEHRTPKGLALEISSQPGKRNKIKMLEDTKTQYPDLYDQVVEKLEEKGLYLDPDRPAGP